MAVHKPDHHESNRGIRSHTSRARPSEPPISSARRALPKVGLPDATRSISPRSDRVWLAAARNRQTRLQPSKGRSQQLRTPDAGRTCSSTSVRLVLACMARLYASRRRCPPVQTARMSNLVGPSSSRCSLKSDWRAGGKSADKLRLRQSKPSQWSRSNTNNESGNGGRLSGPTAESLKLEMPFRSLTTIPDQAARTDAQFLQRCSDAAKRLRPVQGSCALAAGYLVLRCGPASDSRCI